MPTFRRSPGSSTVSSVSGPPRSAFTQGLFTNLLNPKAVLFFAAVLPHFVVPGVVPVAVQVAALGLLDVALGFVIWGAVVVLGVRISAVLQRAHVRAWWDRGTGTVLASLGGGLILARNA